MIEKARNKLLNYLAKAERTVYDCKILLKKHKYPDDIIEQVISEAIEQNWLSDKRYAKLYAENASLSMMSPLSVKHKLFSKKIDSALVTEAVNTAFDPESVKDILETMIDKLLKINQGLTGQKLYQKIATTLYRKGFEYEMYEEMLKRKVAGGG